MPLNSTGQTTKLTANTHKETELRAIIFDVETTGMNTPEIIEAAWEDAEGNGEDITVVRFQPTKPIELGAIAAHHILPSDLVGCPPSSDFRLPDGVEFLIGFNVDYDWECAGKPDVRRIDLCAVARVLYPGLDSYKQNAVFYHLFGATESTRDMLVGAHSAAVDVQNCAEIFDRMKTDTEITDIGEFWLYSEDCRIPRIMPFGKHKGEPIGNVPKGYRDWYSKQVDTDPLILSAFDRFPCEV
ncbi:DEDDh domain containing protein [uncultured Caudovirales phage]|uniref:DEDDh domain containing protein n=1 Tax=uncultured Caudovirales phage TaxID=2100421 RepID=A0A6J5RDW9_9CAUD|nr:DEDDh domain containing protein [uncultured Caudovirales phage]